MNEGEQTKQEGIINNIVQVYVQKNERKLVTFSLLPCTHKQNDEGEINRN